MHNYWLSAGNIFGKKVETGNKPSKDQYYACKGCPQKTVKFYVPVWQETNYVLQWLQISWRQFEWISRFQLYSWVSGWLSRKGLELYKYADGGPRSWVPARGTLCSAPHWHERKFFAARVCRIALNHLPRLLRTHFKSFRKKTLKSLKIPKIVATTFAAAKPPAQRPFGPIIIAQYFTSTYKILLILF